MDKQTLLTRLASGEPLFCSFPKVKEKRIIGTEIEFGSIPHANRLALEEDPRLPMVLSNGGEVYVDKHLEYASPEVPDAVSAVAYYEAGKLICQTFYVKFLKSHLQSRGSWHPALELRFL